MRISNIYPEMRWWWEEGKPSIDCLIGEASKKKKRTKKKQQQKQTKCSATANLTQILSWYTSNCGLKC